MIQTPINVNKCIERVRGEGKWGGFHKHQCPRKPQEGKSYCKQHDPDIRRAKSEAEDKAYRERDAKQKSFQSLFSGNGVYVQGHEEPFRISFLLSEKQLRELAARLSNSPL